MKPFQQLSKEMFTLDFVNFAYTMLKLIQNMWVSELLLRFPAIPIPKLKYEKHQNCSFWSAMMNGLSPQIRQLYTIKNKAAI